MKILYFTATGNSLYVARQIGGELLSIPQLIREESCEVRDTAVGIVCPVCSTRFLNQNVTVQDIVKANNITVR